MAKKMQWRICHQCLERFEAETAQALGRLVELHHVNGTDCMGQKQLAMTFRRSGDAWVAR